MEQFAGSEHERAGIATAEAKAGGQRADGKMQSPGGGELGQRENFSQALDLGFGRGDDEHVIPVSDRIQLITDAADIAAEPLDRLQRQVAVHPSRASLNFSGRYNRKPAARA